MFYVYMYRDPRPTKDRQPVYVGKGSGRRSEAHWLHGNKVNKIFDAWLKAIRREELEPIIEIVAEFELEEDAFKKECELIALFGRKDKCSGPLCNCTDGGEGIAGRIITPELRQQLSKSALSRKSEVHHSKEFRAKVGGISEGQWATTAYREKTVASMKAACATPEGFAKKAAATAAGWANPSTREKRVAGIKASRTPELRAQIGASCAALWDDAKRLEQSAKMRAVLASPEMKAQRAAVMKARWADPVFRAKRLAAKALKNPLDTPKQ